MGGAHPAAALPAVEYTPARALALTPARSPAEADRHAPPPHSDAWRSLQCAAEAPRPMSAGSPTRCKKQSGVPSPPHVAHSPPPAVTRAAARAAARVSAVGTAAARAAARVSAVGTAAARAVARRAVSRAAATAGTKAKASRASAAAAASAGTSTRAGEAPCWAGTSTRAGEAPCRAGEAPVLPPAGIDGAAPQAYVAGGHRERHLPVRHPQYHRRGRRGGLCRGWRHDPHHRPQREHRPTSGRPAVVPVASVVPRRGLSPPMRRGRCRRRSDTNWRRCRRRSNLRLRRVGRQWRISQPAQRTRSRPRTTPTPQQPRSRRRYY